MTMPDHTLPLVSSPSQEAMDMTALYAAHITEVQAKRHSEGFSFSVLGADGMVQHVWPDGSIHHERFKTLER
jgi:hypothetical protein